MAEILLLPTNSSNFRHLSRLCSDLSAAHEQGMDLGSRALHIRSAGERLRELSRSLADAIDELNVALEPAGLQNKIAGASLRQLLCTINELADTTQRVPVDF